MDIKCIVKLNYDAFHIPKSPSLFWRAEHVGLEDPAFHSILELLNSVSCRDAFWTLGLEKYQKYCYLIYYTKNSGLTLPAFVCLLKETIEPLLSSEELQSKNIYFHPGGVDYESVLIRPTYFFEKHCR